MNLDIDYTMRFLESDIPVNLNFSLYTLGLFVATMSVIVGTTIYRWNLNRE